MAQNRDQEKYVGHQGGQEMGPFAKDKGDDAPASADLTAAGQTQAPQAKGAPRRDGNARGAEGAAHSS